MGTSWTNQVQGKFMPLRKTRDGVVIEDLQPPYEVVRDYHEFHKAENGDGLVHTCGWIRGANAYITCCRIRFGPTLVCHDGPTCMKCVLCRGCPACVDGWIRDETMRMGKWETKDRRKLYPFEMDDIHLINAIAKLEREQDRFKEAWVDWCDALIAEAEQRGLR